MINVRIGTVRVEILLGGQTSTGYEAKNYVPNRDLAAARPGIALWRFAEHHLCWLHSLLRLSCRVRLRERRDQEVTGRLSQELLSDAAQKELHDHCLAMRAHCNYIYTPAPG